jgi:hypothetical protein
MYRSNPRSRVVSRSIHALHYARKKPVGYRRGVTLLEVVQTITLTGMLASLSVTVLAGSFRAHRLVLDRYREIEGLEQFSRRWRDDIQRAVEISIVTPGSNEDEVDGEEDHTLAWQALELVHLQADRRQVIRYTKEYHAQVIIRRRTIDNETIGEDRWPVPRGGKLAFAFLSNRIPPDKAVAVGSSDPAGVSEGRLIEARLEYAESKRPPQLWLATYPSRTVTSQTASRSVNNPASDEALTAP